MDSARKAEIRARVAAAKHAGGWYVASLNPVGPYPPSVADVADLLAEVERLTAQITAVSAWRERMRAKMIVEGDLDDLMAALAAEKGGDDGDA